MSSTVARIAPAQDLWPTIFAFSQQNAFGAVCKAFRSIFTKHLEKIWRALEREEGFKDVIKDALKKLTPQEQKSCSMRLSAFLDVMYFRTRRSQRDPHEINAKIWDNICKNFRGSVSPDRFSEILLAQTPVIDFWERVSFDFSNRHLSRIPGFVFLYPGLKELNLSHNSFTQAPVGLEKLKNLEIVDLRSNDIKPEDAVKLLNLTKQLPKLKEFRM